ncbi:AAA domain-domain-containing protein, partial [Protomyces lactucae-debilis]
MNADIMSIANELIYGGMLKCGTPQIAAQQLQVDSTKALESVHAHGSCHTPCLFESILSPKRSVAFLNTDDIAEAKETKRGDQTQNAVESMLIAQIVSSLVAGGVAQHAIGVISPYRSQLKLLHADLEAFPHVMVDTADKFQGRDKECILVSFVRSNSTGQVGDLLKDWRRINVALTRAKRKLICIGSQETLAHDALLNKFVHLAHRRGWSIDLPSDVLQQHVAKQPASGVAVSLSTVARMDESLKENRETRKRNSPKVVHAGQRVLFKNGARPILRDLKNEM